MRRTASSMVVILAVAAASAFNSPAIAIQPTVAASDMRLELSCHRGRQSRTLSLEVRLRNESGADTAVVLGLVLGNGAHLSMALTVLSGKLGPSPEEFRYSPPEYPRISGNVQAWVVPLASGASYSMSVPAAHFLSKNGRLTIGGSEREVRVVLQAGPIPLLRQDSPLRLLTVWTGEVTSNTIKLPSACQWVR